MSVSLVLPDQLRDLAPDGTELRLEGSPATVRVAMDDLRIRHPAIYDRIITEGGEVRPHVNVFVGHENIRWMEGLDTALPSDAELVILPAVSGG